MEHEEDCGCQQCWEQRAYKLELERDRLEGELAETKEELANRETYIMGLMDDYGDEAEKRERLEGEVERLKERNRFIVDDCNKRLRQLQKQVIALQDNTTCWKEENDRLRAALEEIANDGCGLVEEDVEPEKWATCIGKGLPKEDSCWCCNARRALYPAGGQGGEGE